MTVYRQKDHYFDAESPAVAASVRVVLSRRPPYYSTKETERDLTFKTTIRPTWLVWGTDMTVEIQPSSKSTQVVARTQSQWFILGDIHDYYNQYLDEFLSDVQKELKRHMSEGSNKEHKEAPALLEKTAGILLDFNGAFKILFSLFWLAALLWILLGRIIF